MNGAPVTPTSAATRRDRGAALPLVLVMMVILALVIIPTLNYAVSVVAANNVLSDKNERVEAVKAGLRIALSDPESLFQECTPGNSGHNTGLPLASVDLNSHTVTTRCYLQDSADSVAGDQLRVGVAATQLGQAPPVELRGTAFTSSASTSDWLALISEQTTTDQIWLPRLPVSGLTLEPRAGREMQSEFPTCTVYFPGTYLDPVVVDGPTFFTSGVYYFEQEIRVVGGADAVVGGGAIEGCTTDLEAIAYTVDPPSSVSMSGLGATWIFGDRGRLVVDNSNGSELSLRFNRRYAPDEDPSVSSSQDVSIISVNGELDVDSNAIDLVVPGVVEVPRSLVGAGPSPEEATDQDFRPSRYSPRPKEPEAPTNVVAVGFDEAAVVSWDAPYDNLEAVTDYSVTALPSGESCTTRGATSCVVTGLDDYDEVTFNVVATNALGDSVPSDPSNPITPDGSDLQAPERPARPSVEATADGEARISWTAPPSDAPITSYTVEAAPGGYTCDVDVSTARPPDLVCDVTGLDESYGPGYQFSVVAQSAVGSSSASPLTSATRATGSPPLDPLEPASPSALTGTPPLVDLDLEDAAAATVDIPGYIATPQGRVRVNNPNGHAGVVIGGGILAASYDVVDSRMTVGDPGSLGDIGFIIRELQRRYLLVSSIDGEYEQSRAIVQVNENGAYAVNSWEVQ